MEVSEYIDLKLTHSIHTSERKSFRACRRRWNWIFREYWYPTTTAKPLEFGVAYHKGMEVFYEPETWEMPREVVTELAISAFKETCAKQRKAYIDQSQTGTIDDEVEEDYKERVKLGEGMLRYYAEKVSPVEDVNIKPVRVEIGFEVPITNPGTDEQLWCKCEVCWKRFLVWTTTDRGQREFEDWPTPSYHGWQGLPVTYGGRIDALMEDQILRYWVYDWKTTARMAADNTEFLQLDDQITSYCWACWKLGLPVAGFIYHEQKKGFPQEPAMHKSGRRYKGTLFSTSKTQDTTYLIYHTTVSENDPEGYAKGAYDEFLEHLQENPPKFYERHQVHRSKREIENAGRMIYLEALDMIDERLRIYPNPGRFGCSFCAFRQPCMGVNNDEDYMYTLETLFDKRRYHYWEDTQSSTDGKGGQ